MDNFFYETGLSQVVISEQQHADFLSKNLRQSDIDEVWSAYWLTPANAIQSVLNKSAHSYTWLYKDEPVAMFGAQKTTVIGNVGSPWFLGTNRMTELFSTLYRNSGYFIDLMHDDFPMLENYVDCRNALSIRWLRWCGFEFDSPKRYGIENELFMRFWRYRQCV